MSVFQPGNYWGKVKQQRLGKTSNDNMQFILTFDVIGMVDPSNPDGDLAPCPNYERSIFRVITDKTIDYVVADLELLGIEINDWGQLDEANPQCFSIIGNDIPVRMELSEYQGKTREQWQLNRGGGSLEVKPPDQGDMAKLNAMFGSKLRRPKPVPRTAPPASQTRESPPVAAGVSEGKKPDLPF